MFRTTHIRSKLAVALAVPLAALAIVAGFEVIEAKSDVDETRSQSELATSSLGPGSLVTRLQDERNRASIDLIGLDTELPVATNAEARPLTDAAAAELMSEIDGRGGEVAEAFEPAFEAYQALGAIRADIDSFTGPQDLSNDEFANEIFTRYTDIIETFFDATSSVALSVDSSELRNGVEIVDAATRQSEMRARIVRSLVLGVVTGSADDPSVSQEIAALADRANGFDDNIRTNATGPYAGVADATFEEPDVRSFVTQVEAFLADGTVDIVKILDSVKTQSDTGYTGLRARAADLLTDEANRIEAEALERQRLFILLAAGTLLLAVIVTWLASRSITRPLRSLQAQANEMAHGTLPAAVREILDTPPGEDVVIPDVEPIQVKTRDEVREVAAALSAVQTSAVDLAVEQAVLRRNIADSYINLGRRNQNLLSRQLDFITDLERNEGDPDALEGLFKLDHLATRMRRNAESLLVLAGVEPPRQWSAPVKASDVVRAALGEVEDYKRVIVRHLEPASLTGAVASDVAHVLAELIENGLSFSPPDQTVEVKGRLTTAGYTIAVSDNGLGMPAEDIERANRRLAGKESFTVAPSRYLGHYVAGHLASRLGIAVELQASPAGGITARVDIPMSLVANEETDPALQRRPAAAAGPAPTATQRDVAPPVGIAQSATVPMAEPAPAPAATTPNGLQRRGERPASPAAPASPSTPATPGVPAHMQGQRQLSPQAAPAPESSPTAAEPMPSEELTGVGGVAADAPAQEPDGAELTSASFAQQPASPSPAPSGFGGLAVARPSHGSMYSVAARLAREGSVDDHDGSVERATRTGLPRRVPGAQRPDMTFGRTAPAATTTNGGGEDSARTTPEDVYSFLSSFQSGVAKGRADAHGEKGDDTQENPR